MADKTVKITLQFINKDLDKAANFIARISANLSVMANAFRDLSPTQIKAIYGEITGGSEAAAAATAKLAAEKKAEATILQFEKQLLADSAAMEKRATDEVNKAAIATKLRADGMTKLNDALRLSRVSRAEQIALINRTTQASKELAATERQLALDKAKVTQTTKLGNESMTRFNQLAGKQNTTLNQLATLYVKVANGVSKWADQQEKLKSKSSASLFSTITSGVTAVSTAVTAVISVMRTAYMWLSRIYNVIGRLTNGLINMVKEFGEFQTIVRSASFILQTNMGTIVEAAQSVNFLGISMTDAAQGLDEFGRAGYLASEALQAFAPIAMFADAVNTNLGRATTMVTGAMKSFNFEAEDVWRITSGMTNAVYESRNSFETLETAMAYAGAAGAAFGQSYEEVLASVMAFRDLGLKASTSGTIYRRALARLANATKPTADAFKALNLDIRQFTVQSGNSFNDVIKNFAALRKEITGKEFTGLISKTIGPRFASYITKLVDAVNVGRINLDDAAQKLREKSDTLAELTKYNMTTIEQQIRIFSSLIERMWLVFDSKLAEKLLPFLSAFNVFALDLLDSWTITMDKMALATEDGIKKMTKEDMGKAFKAWEKDIVASLDGIVKWLNKYKGVIEKLLFIAEVGAKTFALPFVLLSTALLKLGAYIPMIGQMFSTMWGTIRKVLGSAAQFVYFFLELLASGGVELARIFEVPPEMLNGIDKLIEKGRLLVDEFTGTWDTNFIDAAEWKDTTDAMNKAGDAFLGFYGKAVTTNISSSAGQLMDDLVVSIGKLREEVDAGAIGEKIGNIVDIGEKKAKESMFIEQLESIYDKAERIFINYNEDMEKKAKEQAAKDAAIAKAKAADDLANWKYYVETYYTYTDEANQKLAEETKAHNEEMAKLEEERQDAATSHLKLVALANKKYTDDKRKELEKAEAELEKMVEQWANWADAQDKKVKADRLAREKTHKTFINTLVSEGLATRLQLTSANFDEMEKLIEQHYANLAAKEAKKADDEATRRILTQEGYTEGWRQRLETLNLTNQEEAVLMDEMTLKHADTAGFISRTWEAVALSWGTTRQLWQDALKSMVDSMATGMQSLFMTLFDKSKKIKDVFKDMAKSMLASILGALAKILIQKLLFSKASDKIAEQQGVSSIGKNNAMAISAASARGWETGYGPAGAIAAAINVGIATATGTAAMTALKASGKSIENAAPKAFDGTGLAGVPGLYTGQDNTLMNVSPGEIILSNKESDMVREMAATGGTSGGDTYNITINAADGPSVAEWFKNQFVKTIRESAEAKRATRSSMRKQGA